MGNNNRVGIMVCWAGWREGGMEGGTREEALGQKTEVWLHCGIILHCCSTGCADSCSILPIVSVGEFSHSPVCHTCICSLSLSFPPASSLSLSLSRKHPRARTHAQSVLSEPWAFSRLPVHQISLQQKPTSPTSKF